MTSCVFFLSPVMFLFFPLIFSFLSLLPFIHLFSLHFIHPFSLPFFFFASFFSFLPFFPSIKLVIHSFFHSLVLSLFSWVLYSKLVLGNLKQILHSLPLPLSLPSLFLPLHPSLPFHLTPFMHYFSSASLSQHLQNNINRLAETQARYNAAFGVI